MAEHAAGLPFMSPLVGTPSVEAPSSLTIQASQWLAMAGALPAMSMPAPGTVTPEVPATDVAAAAAAIAAATGCVASGVQPITVGSVDGEIAPAALAPMDVDVVVGDGIPAVGMMALPEVPASAPPEIELEELEENSEEDKRPRLSQQVCIYTSDTTLNIMPSLHGNVLIPLTDGAMQFLLAGARANVGIQDGRYFFETRIVEVLNPQETQNYVPHHEQRLPQPRQVLKVGFALAGSSLFLGEDEGSICFDSEGIVTHNKQAMATVQKFTRDQVIGVLLNLEEGSPNYNTVSLFRDGARVSKPQPLPPALRGKPLFPAITFRSITVQVNFGPTRMAQLPFVCRTLQEAALSDVAVRQDPKPRDGKYEVLVPVFLPDEGTFDWLDMFLEKHPDYVELSHRMLLDWAEKSGIQRPRMCAGSGDRPDMLFGIPQIDEDVNLRRILSAVAPVQQRNMVVMEVNDNLMKDARHEFLKRFSLSHFKKVARVLIGEPTKDFKETNYSLMLKDKQNRADAEWKARKLEKTQEKILEQKQKELERERKRQERQAKKAAAEAAKREEGERNPLTGEPRTVEEQKEKMAVDGEQEAEKAESDDDADEVEQVKHDDDSEAPRVQLTEEESKRWFRKKDIPDLTMPVFAANFTNFTIPRKEEGFDDIHFDWHKRAASTEYMKQWILEKKITTRVEDITPSDWFREQWSGWQAQLQKWHQKQNEWKDPSRIAAAAAAAAAAKAKQDNDTEEARDEEMKDGEEKETKLGGAKEEAKDGKNNGWLAVEEDDGLDVFCVTDVCDINGKGEPLFSNFAFEDWALLSLRYELHLLVHAFRRDVNDVERAGIHQDQLPFYYNRYFKKAFSTKYYGVDTYNELVDFIRDTVTIDAKSLLLESHLFDELDNFDVFLKLTEECRRYRQLRLDSGEKLPSLNFSRPPPPAQATAAAGAGTKGAGPRPFEQHRSYKSEPYHRSGAKGPPMGKSYGPPGSKGGGYGGYCGGAPKGGGGYYGKGPRSQGKGGYPPQQGYSQGKPHNGPYGKGGYGR
eukprot:TRINITY_DN615_c0_g3_i1.p1 TRINITY_DN615_c0_g3~~TRINITY_DN615_c0_g3_i1.p1  ORF type:complete len:1029 (-),score=234.97 TRINITY_DN615_c0_g3_i1:166-3252(-)